jgi:predicted permease
MKKASIGLIILFLVLLAGLGVAIYFAVRPRAVPPKFSGDIIQLSQTFDNTTDICGNPGYFFNIIDESLIGLGGPPNQMITYAISGYTMPQGGGSFYGQVTTEMSTNDGSPTEAGNERSGIFLPATWLSSFSTSSQPWIDVQNIKTNSRTNLSFVLDATVQNAAISHPFSSGDYP